MKVIIFFAVVVLALASGDSTKKCLQEAEEGLCRAHFEMYYYDYKSRSCKLFVYGGCGGNDNKFTTEDDCMKECGAKCSSDKDCPFGKICAESGLCVCSSPDLGKNCEKIPSEQCQMNLTNCISSGGACEYDFNKKIFCDCGQNTWDEIKAICVVSADECKIFAPNCSKTGGSCKTTAEGIQCECPEDKIVDSLKKECTVSKEMCEKNFSRCLETYGTCEANETGIYCECDDEILIQDSSKFHCKLADGICEKDYKKCLDTGGTCKLHKTDVIRCECPDGKVPDSSQDICTECPIGEAEKNGTCTACKCGANSKGCKFYGEKKICDCYPNFVQKGDICKETTSVNSTTVIHPNSTTSPKDLTTNEPVNPSPGDGGKKILILNSIVSIKVQNQK